MLTSCHLYVSKEQNAFAINTDLIIRTHFLSNIGDNFMFFYVFFTDHFMELRFKFWYLISMKYFEIGLGLFSQVVSCFYNIMQFWDKKKTHNKENTILFPFHFQENMPKETNFNAIKLKAMPFLVLLCFEKHHRIYVGILVL